MSHGHPDVDLGSAIDGFYSHILERLPEVRSTLQQYAERPLREAFPVIFDRFHMQWMPQALAQQRQALLRMGVSRRDADAYLAALQCLSAEVLHALILSGTQQPVHLDGGWEDQDEFF